jgi:ketosteroid isomerase-like protein
MRAHFRIRLTRVRVMFVALLACAAGAQPTSAQRPTAAPAPAMTGPGAEVLTLEQKIEEAVVRGDAAFVDRVLTSDFVFHHGSGWARGEHPGGTRDDKKAFLKRVQDKEYLIHDLDRVKVEMHGDLAITYGRYVSLFMPPGRTNPAPGRLTTIWFVRVYAKRDGEWKFVSHRTVFGPNNSPAGVDPAMISTAEQAKAYVPGKPEVNVPAKTYPPQSPEAAEVLAFEKSVGDAIVRGDVAYFDKVTVPTLVMIHGDNWTRGGPLALVDSKETFLDRVRKKQYNAHDFDSVRVDMHGDVAITYGRYVAQIAGREKTDRPWFSVWFHRVYQKQNGQWKYVSHRTIHGASHGTREQVSLR